MKVRLAGNEDFDQAVALLSEFGGEPPVPGGQEGLAVWRQIVGHAGTSVFVADTGSRFAGTVTLHVMPNLTYGGRPYGLIENVITAASHRGQGVGRLVMEAAIEAALKAGVYKIMLLTGKNRSDGGVTGFYEKLGFSADAKHGMILRVLPPRAQ